MAHSGIQQVPAEVNCLTNTEFAKVACTGVNRQHTPEGLVLALERAKHATTKSVTAIQREQ
jgi:hypothetical protein